jgi:hypothetical protein
MNQGRIEHTCGVLNWMNPQSNQMEKVVVAAGGAYTSVTELLYVDRIGEYSWIMGPTMPETNTFDTMVEFQNSIIRIGGTLVSPSTNIYQLHSPGARVIKNFFATVATARKLQCYHIFVAGLTIASNLTKGQPALPAKVKPSSKILLFEKHYNCFREHQ